MNEIILGDCIQEMAKLKDKSIDLDLKEIWLNKYGVKYTKKWWEFWK